MTYLVAALAGLAGGVLYHWVKDKVMDRRNYPYGFTCPHGDLVFRSNNWEAVMNVMKDHEARYHSE